MKTFNSQSLKVVRHAIENALKTVEDDLKLKIDTGRISYTETHFTMKLDVIVQETTDGRSGEQAEFEKYCKMYGFEPKHYGEKVVFGGAEYTFVGFNTRARKNSIIVRDDDGKEAVTSPSIIKRKLEKT